MQSNTKRHTSADANWFFLCFPRVPNGSNSPVTVSTTRISESSIMSFAYGNAWIKKNSIDWIEE